jgi:hypothetical protein
MLSQHSARISVHTNELALMREASAVPETTPIIFSTFGKLNYVRTL